VNFEEVLQKFEARRVGANYMARCPAHEDKNPSLSIAQKDGKTLLNCMAGCATKDVLGARGLTFEDLYQGPVVTAEYDYLDECGELLFQVLRYEPKTFKQRHPDGKGGWVWNLNGTRRVPYRLADFLPKPSVLIVEGEKDVERARAMGLTATCNPGGAGSWKDDYDEFFENKNVTIIPDNDTPGRKHAEQVAASLHGKAASVAICHLPAGVKDLSAWPLSPESLIELIKQAPAWTPESAAEEKLGSCSVAELFAAREKEVDWMVWPWAAVGLATILDALPKVGKTVFILRGIHASLYGKPFLNYPTQKMRAIYISEQSRPSLAVQMREIGFTGAEPIEELRLVTREDWSRCIYTELLAKLEKEILASGTYNCLVIDTLHTVSRMEDESNASEVNRLGNLTLDIASRNNVALVLGRHDRKSGGEVGVSGRSSIQLSGLVDVILHLVRVPNQATQRKLELLGRVPGLPTEQTIELLNGTYLNWGEPTAPAVDREEQVAVWYAADSNLIAPEIVARFAAMSVVISLATAKRDLAKVKGRKK
jgi:hypothetical protein